MEPGAARLRAINNAGTEDAFESRKLVKPYLSTKHKEMRRSVVGDF
jgi:hypothetical protein